MEGSGAGWLRIDQPEESVPLERSAALLASIARVRTLADQAIAHHSYLTGGMVLAALDGAKTGEMAQDTQNAPEATPRGAERP